LKKCLAAALIAAAVPALLASPAGASSARTTWEHWSQPCATGHKSATLVSKRVDGAVTKVWYNNPCKGQWLGLVRCQPDSQSDCTSDAIAPHHKGSRGGEWIAVLMNTKNG